MVGSPEVPDAGHARGLPQAPIQRILPPALACVYVACIHVLGMFIIWRLMLSSVKGKHNILGVTG